MMRGDECPLFLSSKKLSKFSTGGRASIFSFKVITPARQIDLAPVDSMLTVWLSLRAFTGRDCSGLYLTRNRVARCYFGF